MDKSFTISLDGIDYSVDVEGQSVVVNGYPYLVGVGHDGKVVVDSITYDIVLSDGHALIDGTSHELQVSGLETTPTAKEPIKRTETSRHAGVIQAIMPGSIVRVLASEGDRVRAGDVVLVLEAMKMENELKAAIDGLVSAIHVRPGQVVEMNSILAELEPLDGA